MVVGRGSTPFSCCLSTMNVALPDADADAVAGAAGQVSAVDGAGGVLGADVEGTSD